MGIWVSPTFWLLWIRLPRMWMYKYLFKTVLSVLWGLYQVEWLNHLVILLLISWRIAIIFSIALHHFTFPSTVHKDSKFSISLPTIVISSGFFWIVSILMAAAAAAKSRQSCPTLRPPQTAAHQAPPSLGFSRQEHWSGLSFPSPTQKSEKRMWSHSAVSDS